MKLLFLIPGLAMNGNEFATFGKVLTNPGFILESGEVSGSELPENYTIEDIAERHAREVSKQVALGDTPTLVGFSMGGMVLSVMATKFRHLLPKNTKFIFVNTSPNLRGNPVLTDEIVRSWNRQDNESLYDYFYRTMKPFFSSNFLATHPDEYGKYIQYRSRGGNRQPVKEYTRQVAAIQKWDGTEYYKKLNPSECIFVFSEGDQVINDAHIRDLKSLVAQPNIKTIQNAGHLISVENPHAFEKMLIENRSLSCNEILE